MNIINGINIGEQYPNKTGYTPHFEPKYKILNNTCIADRLTYYGEGLADLTTRILRRLFGNLIWKTGENETRPNQKKLSNRITISNENKNYLSATEFAGLKEQLRGYLNKKVNLYDSIDQKKDLISLYNGIKRKLSSEQKKNHEFINLLKQCGIKQ